MKKYLMTAMAAVALGSAFVSCTHDIAEYNAAESFQQRYEDAFIQLFGQPAANQDWGFGSFAQAASSRIAYTRSQSAPACPDIDKPYDEAWVANYNQTATEPNSTNVADNYNNTTYAVNYDVVNYLTGDEWTLKDNLMNSGKSWEEQLAWMLENRPNWLTFNKDETYVTNFKITGTWDGDINVAGSEGSSSPGAERTIVVTGTWNITADQRIGSLGKIIIANGGTVNVASGKTLNMVNEARLVVLPGGTLTGAGKVEVNNGNASGHENYNGGTINVATFNNNFGKFYNYGQFLVTEYQGGAKESNFYNHALVNVGSVGGTGSTANARVFNACQFYVQNNARLRNYEGVMGSALIVAGQFMPFGSEDGTSDPSYVGLEAGALVKCGSLYNGSSWSGPTSGGYAALEIVNQIDYMTWTQDSPETAGYFENNIYVKCGDWQNDPKGQGYHNDDPNDPYENGYNYKVSRAEYKFFHIAANCRGNGNVTKVEDSSNILIDADSDFTLGSTGCTPGFTGTPTDNPEPPTTTEDPTEDPTEEPTETPTETPTEPEEPVNFVADIRIIAEDLTYSEDINGKPAKSDIDFNDVVFDVMFNNDGTAWVQLVAAGGTLPLVVGGTNDTSGLGEGHEVHDYFGVSRGTMVNTNSKTGRNGVPLPKPFKVSGTSTSDMGKNIPVYVQKQGSWIELRANLGEPASKLGVKPGFSYCDERQSIDDAYPKFKDWVNNPDVRWYDE